jgi:hypothetical protein
LWHWSQPTFASFSSLPRGFALFCYREFLFLWASSDLNIGISEGKF